MGAPLFRYLGDLARLHDIPHVPYRGGTENLDDLTLNGALDQARALQRVWGVVAAGASHPWFGLQVDGGFLGFRSDVEAELSDLHAATNELSREVQRIAVALGLPPPTTFTAIQSLHRLADTIDAAPRVRPEWLSIDGRALQDDILDWKRAFDERSTAAAWIQEAHVESAIRSADFSLASWSEKYKSLKALFGSEDAIDQLLATLPESLRWTTALKGALNSLVAASKKLCAELGTEHELSVASAESLIRATEMAASGVHPEVGWFAHEQHTKLSDGLTPLRDDVISAAIMRREILEGYEQGIFDVDIDQLIEKFAGDYRSPFRFFSAEYRRTMVILRAVRKDGKIPKTLVADLRHIRDYLRREKELADRHSVTIDVLGDRYKKAATDFGKIGRCLELVSNLRKLVEVPSARLIDIMAGRESAARASSLAEEVKSDLNQLRTLFLDSNAVCVDRRLVSLQDDPHTAPLYSVIPVVDELWRAATDCEAYVSAAFETMPRDLSVSFVFSVAAHVERYRDLERVSGAIQARILRDFGGDYLGQGEPMWLALETVAEWLTHKDIVLEHANDIILRRIRDGEASVALASGIDRSKTTVNKQTARVSTRFEETESASLRRLRSEDADEVSSVGEFLTRSLDLLQEWRDYRALETQLSNSEFAQLFSSMIAIPDLDPAKLVEITWKSVLQGYVDAQILANSALREFRGDAHFELIREFRRLDTVAIADNSRRVLERSLKRRPTQLIAYQGSEARILLTEAGKKKKHLPIRKLFARMPGLLQQLKPCLMMSPLSVSQFLDPDLLRFDCVIFDEASQICSEDAVSAIYRGRQVVICGDKMQLPPTNFFKQGDVVDDVDTDDDDVAVFESILAEAETAGFMPRQLTWHYRSAHESLIAFSNERFYNYSLVTFPSTTSNAEKTAVRFCHVSDGVYDRGGKRQNAVEADRVVQLVLEHIETRPDQSLGVVAFSMQQADAIQNRIEVLQKERRDLSWFFAEERLNGFFVKNLERVQGDERDHIMFSIGYGRDRNGGLTMNFGPVGKPGGEKRLNVAVTRARQQVTVVSSIRASDIDLDRVNSAGVLGLHKYLDFAERGYVALDQHGVQGDYESPFEEDVAGVIRTMGYSVLPQVGVSSFRIDLGVVDPADPGRFILGVECDGATYHSAYTARDRDRLRQEILERKMGWQLYRIWSPDWIQRRNSEIERLHAAIEAARLTVAARDMSAPIGEPSSAYLGVAPIAEEPIAEARIRIVEPHESKAQLWTEAYEVASIRRAPLHCEFHEVAALACLAEMAMEVISIEGPVHKSIVSSRLARRWNLERVGNRMVDTMESVYRALARRGAVDIVDGEFCTMRGAAPIEKVRVPVAGRAETLRNIEHIPEDEISLAVCSLLQEAISFEADQLIVQLARVFGYDRTGSTIRGRLVKTVKRLADLGQIAVEGNRVVRLV